MLEAHLEAVLPGVTAGCQVAAPSSYTQANYSSLDPPVPVADLHHVKRTVYDFLDLISGGRYDSWSKCKR